MAEVAGLIEVELWDSARGTRPLYRQKWSAIPREGDTIQLPNGDTARVWRVTWVVTHRGLGKVKLSLEILTRAVRS